MPRLRRSGRRGSSGPAGPAGPRPVGRAAPPSLRTAAITASWSVVVAVREVDAGDVHALVDQVADERSAPARPGRGCRRSSPVASRARQYLLLKGCQRRAAYSMTPMRYSLRFIYGLALLSGAGCTVDTADPESRRAGRAADRRSTRRTCTRASSRTTSRPGRSTRASAWCPSRARPSRSSAASPACRRWSSASAAIYTGAGRATPAGEPLDRPAGRALAAPRLGRHLPGRAGLQPVQRRGRDARPVALGLDADGARQPRVRQGRRQPVEQQCQRFGGFPILAANYPFADPDRSARSPSCATSSTPYDDLRRRRAQGRRHRHGQPVVDPGHHRGRQLARHPPARRPRRVDRARSRLLRPQVDLLVRGLAPRPRRGRGRRRRRRRVARRERPRSAARRRRPDPRRPPAHRAQPAEGSAALRRAAASSPATPCCATRARSRSTSAASTSSSTSPTHNEQAAAIAARVTAYTYKRHPHRRHASPSDPDIANLLWPYSAAR